MEVKDRGSLWESPYDKSYNILEKEKYVFINATQDKQLRQLIESMWSRNIGMVQYDGSKYLTNTDSPRSPAIKAASTTQNKGHTDVVCICKQVLSYLHESKLHDMEEDVRSELGRLWENIMTVQFTVIVVILPSKITTSGKQSIVKEISCGLNKRTSQLHKEMTVHYDLYSLQANVLETVDDKLFCTVSCKQQKLRLLQDDLGSKNFSNFVKSNARKSSHVFGLHDFELQIDLQAASPQSSERFDSGYESNASGLRGHTDDASVVKRGLQIHVEPYGLYTQQLQDMLKSTQCTPYILLRHLRQNQGKGYRNYIDLAIDGLPLLPYLLVHEKHDCFSAIFHLGWWSIASKQKLKDHESYQNMDVFEIAQTRSSKKGEKQLKEFSSWDESMDPLMKAVRSGDIRYAITLIGKNPERCHYRDSNNGNALYWAVVNGDVEIFVLLLDKVGLDPSMKTHSRETLLHTAALWGQCHLIAPLVNKCKLSSDARDSRRKTAMDRASENGDIKCLEAFIACGIEPKPETLTLAALNGMQEFVCFCIEKIPIHIDTCDDFKRTALLRAAEGGQYILVQYLLNAGADITILAATKRNVLHYAAESGKTDLVRVLLKHLQSIGRLEEFLNAKDRHNGVECMFLIRGRDKGRNAWHYVHVKRHLVPLFLKKSQAGNIDVAWFGKIIKSGWGSNPEQEQSDEIDDIFRQKRLDESAADDMTPLHISIFKGHSNIASLLIENGADGSSCDYLGNTPLMLAASKNMVSIVKLLEDKGAALQDVNKDGQTAAKLAEMSMQTDMINYFTGNDYTTQIKEFLDKDVAEITKRFSDSNLKSLKEKKTDVTKYLIESLRDLSIGVNQTLLNIGSGPILEETI